MEAPLESKPAPQTTPAHQQDSGIESPHRSLDEDAISPTGLTSPAGGEDDGVFDMKEEDAYESIEIKAPKITVPSPYEKTYDRAEGMARPSSLAGRDSGYTSQVMQKRLSTSDQTPTASHDDQPPPLPPKDISDEDDENIYEYVGGSERYGGVDTSDDSLDENIYDEVPQEGEKAGVCFQAKEAGVRTFFDELQLAWTSFYPVYQIFVNSMCCDR